jgi:hypothetical protein
LYDSFGVDELGNPFRVDSLFFVTIGHSTYGYYWVTLSGFTPKPILGNNIIVVEKILFNGFRCMFYHHNS